MATTTGPRPRGDRSQLRIGDAEREEVMTALQDHLAAGRLTVEEYEERAERVVAARYADDLDDLLTDLPPTEAQQERRTAEAPPWAQWRRALPLPMPLLIGLGVLLIIALPGPPFLLFPLLWVGLFLAFARHRRCGGHGGWGRPYGWGDTGRTHDHDAWDGPHRWDGPRAWGAPHGCAGARHQRHLRDHGRGRDDVEPDDERRVV
jgi:hypothetical protein